ncbi:hypothetical protein Ddye_018218, partial [Dipteronia dyeriana]
NREYNTRLAILVNQPIIFERGIQISSLIGTTIPSIIRLRTWENYMATLSLDNITVVKEFYVGMISEQMINEHFGTNLVCQDILPLSYTRFDGSLETLAKLLRGNEYGVWDKKRGLINIGRVIKAEITRAWEIDLKQKKTAVKKLIHIPCLITKLCKKASVPDLDSDEVSLGDKSDLNMRSWNDSTSKTNGRKRLRHNGSSLPERDFRHEESDAEDYNFEASGDEVDP